MINIRNNVFETNSSSSHSISLSPREQMFDTLEQDENGIITLSGGQFGWTGGDFFDPETKANYCAVDCFGNSDKEKMLIEAIKEHTGCKDVVLNITLDGHYSIRSYIDHQSQGTSNHLFSSKTKLKTFIFNPDSYLTLDNDSH